MEIDLHGFELVEAMIEVDYAIRECIGDGESQITIVHGFHSGSVLKNYFRSARFIRDMKKSGVSIKVTNTSNLGHTIVNIV